MEFGMSRRIKPKEKYVRISMKDILAKFGWSAENRIVQLEFSRPKVAQIGPSRCCVVSLGCPYEP